MLSAGCSRLSHLPSLIEATEQGCSLRDSTEYRANCEHANVPLISLATEQFLATFLCQGRYESIAEIGSAAGYSTSILAQAQASYTLYGRVDSREISYPHYWQAVRYTQQYHHVRIYLGNINTINLTRQQRQYDCLFIDGRKSETLAYLKKRIPYLHNGGMIILDDVIKFKEKMQDLYFVLDKNDIPYTIHHLDHDDGIMTLSVTPLLIQALCD